MTGFFKVKGKINFVLSISLLAVKLLLESFYSKKIRNLIENLSAYSLRFQ
ncbi:hypothetical protein SynA1528_02285 [Synechococcus sp. A15-28]|nr:hypothetical protein SynA1528_02285 [Synechococcus sp. A15-28]